MCLFNFGHLGHLVHVGYLGHLGHLASKFTRWPTKGRWPHELKGGHLEFALLFQRVVDEKWQDGQDGQCLGVAILLGVFSAYFQPIFSLAREG